MKPRFILVISLNPFGFGYKIPTTIQKQLPGKCYGNSTYIVNCFITHNNTKHWSISTPHLTVSNVMLVIKCFLSKLIIFLLLLSYMADESSN